MASKSSDLYSGVLDTFRSWDQMRPIEDFQGVVAQFQDSDYTTNVKMLSEDEWTGVLAESLKRGDSDLASMIMEHFSNRVNIFSTTLSGVYDTLGDMILPEYPLATLGSVNLGCEDTEAQIRLLDKVSVMSFRKTTSCDDIDLIQYESQLHAVHDTLLKTSMESLCRINWAVRRDTSAIEVTLIQSLIEKCPSLRCVHISSYDADLHDLLPLVDSVKYLTRVYSLKLTFYGFSWDLVHKLRDAVGLRWNLKEWNEAGLGGDTTLEEAKDLFTRLDGCKKVWMTAELSQEVVYPDSDDSAESSDTPGMMSDVLISIQRGCSYIYVGADVILQL